MYDNLVLPLCCLQDGADALVNWVRSRDRRRFADRGCDLDLVASAGQGEDSSHGVATLNDRDELPWQVSAILTLFFNPCYLGNFYFIRNF